MKKNESITHIMSEAIKSVHTGQKLSEVRHMMTENGIHHVPVVSGSRLVGILSSTDLMKLSFGGYGGDERSLDAIMDHQFTIEDTMQKDVVTLKTSQTVRDAAEVLGEGNFHSLPVVDDSSNLKGIVTTTDLIRYLLAQY
jgi:CBS domain-containing protein